MKKKSVAMTLGSAAAAFALMFVGVAPASAFTGKATFTRTCASNQQVVAWVDPSGSGLGTISFSRTSSGAVVKTVSNQPPAAPGSYVKGKSGLTTAFVDMRSGTATTSYGVACEAR